MSIAKNIEFHSLETWVIRFAAKDDAGQPIDLTGANLFFRISRGKVPLITKDHTNAVTVSNAAQGLGFVTILDSEQVPAGLIAKKEFNYELKIITPSYVTVQSIGVLKVLDSLFTVP
jgi:hypothetical protein